MDRSSVVATVIYFTLFLFRLVIYLVLLPFFCFWYFLKVANHKMIFRRNLVKAGVPQLYAQLLSRQIQWVPVSRRLNTGKAE